MSCKLDDPNLSHQDLVDHCGTVKRSAPTITRTSISRYHTGTCHCCRKSRFSDMDNIEVSTCEANVFKITTRHLRLPLAWHWIGGRGRQSLSKSIILSIFYHATINRTERNGLMTCLRSPCFGIRYCQQACPTPWPKADISAAKDGMGRICLKTEMNNDWKPGGCELDVWSYMTSVCSWCRVGKVGRHLIGAGN